MAPTEVSSVAPGFQFEFTQLKNELLGTIRMLCSKHGLLTSGGPKTAFLGKLLASNACERRISYLLKNHDQQEADQRFDPLYGLKSEYAVLKLVDHLKTRLLSEGLGVSIATEVEYEFGISDIQVDLLASDDKTNIGIVRIEVKAGLGLSLEQLERYLWSGSPLVVVRVMTRHVAALEPSQLRRFVQCSMEEAIAKGKRLVNGDSRELPGTYCSGCPDFGCPHNRHKHRKTMAMVKIREEEFESDLQSFFDNIPAVAENTANVVTDLLTRFNQRASETRSP